MPYNMVVGCVTDNILTSLQNIKSQAEIIIQASCPEGSWRVARR
jgi:hypothetical protein